MAMVQSSRLMQQETLWARVNGLREGGSTMDTQMCSSLKPEDVLVWKMFLPGKSKSGIDSFQLVGFEKRRKEKRGSRSHLKLAISLFFAALKVLLVMPSPRSALSQQPHKNCHTCRVWRSCTVTLLMYLFVKEVEGGYTLGRFSAPVFFYFPFLKSRTAC